jgi:hypothetical protein
LPILNMCTIHNIVLLHLKNKVVPHGYQHLHFS